MTESPFAPSRRYLLGSRVAHDFGQRYPALIAPMASSGEVRFVVARMSASVARISLKIASWALDWVDTIGRR